MYSEMVAYLDTKMILFKQCLPIWQEIVALEEKDISIKYQSIRGIVTEDILF